MPRRHAPVSDATKPSARPRASAPAPSTTADRVVAALVGHIRKHRLPAGASLPSELQTSSRLQVSRSVVREAYRSLSAAGLVDIANGRSPRVGQITNRALMQLLEHALFTRQASATQILELRSPIEEHAAEIAATHRTDADLVELRAAVAAMRAAGSQPEPYVAADLRFHEAIGRATGNPMFTVAVSALRGAMGESIRVSLAGRRSKAELARVVGTHTKIVDAIAAQKPRDARRWMVKHFDEALASVRRLSAADRSAAPAPAAAPPRRPPGRRTRRTAL